VGNRLFGERLTELVSLEQLKLAAAAVLLSPCQPLLFMGEEYGETARFQFFISHTDLDLVEAVRRGRKEEFARFRWTEEPPDPQDEATFLGCKLNHDLKQEGHHRVLRDFYKRLIEIRKSETSLAFPDRDRMNVSVLPTTRAMAVHTWSQTSELFTVFHFGPEAATASAPLPTGPWRRILDSADTRWNGAGSQLPQRVESSGEVRMPLAPHSVVAYKDETDN
jgi:maltooligosyltrehalose trehalohydrolase